MGFDMTDRREQADTNVEDSIAESSRVISGLIERSPAISDVAAAVIASLEAGQKVLTIGHGGSAADALHMSEELLGRFDADRRPLPAVSLVADPTLMTCIANDYGFEHVFARQVQGLGASGDVLVVFSTSGNGTNLRNAVEAAREKDLVTVGLLGKGGGELADLCDYTIIVDSRSTARVQEAHTVILHLILEQVDRRFVDDQ